MANNLLVPNVYYTAEQYVDPVLYSTPQSALVDQKLIYPLLQDAGNYQVAIAKAEIPLDTIPLTRYNIPLKRYEVILRQGANEASAYLRQLNASTKDFLWNCSPTGIVNLYYYTTTGSLQSVGSTDCSGFVPNGVSFFAVDDYRNAYFATASLAGGLVNKVVVVNLTTVTQLATLDATLIQGMDLDRGNKLYIADEEVDGSVVKVYSNQNSASEVNLILIQTITQDYQGNPLTSIRTVCADQTLLVGYDVNKFSIYNITTYVAYTGFTNASITHMGRASALNSSGQGTFIVVDDGQIDDLFVGAKTPDTSYNLYNMTSNTLFGEPDISLDGMWTPDTKFALTDTGYGFGVGTDNQLYAFGYDSTTAQPTSQPFLVSSSFAYTSVACSDTRADLFVSTGRSLCGLNLDNTTNNNVLEFNTEFQLGGSTPLSWDFQASSKKIVGIDSTTNNLNITSKPIYPKNFVVITSPSETSTQTALYVNGSTWNTAGTQTAPVTQIQTNTMAPADYAVCDAFEEANGDIVQLGSSSTQPVIYVTDINGVLQNTFNLTAGLQYNTICRPNSNVVATIDNTGLISVFNTTTGALYQTINTGYVSNPSIDMVMLTGGKIFGGSLYLIVVIYGTTITIYGSSNGSTGYSQIFTTSAIIPTGASVANYFSNGILYGAGYASPQPYLVLVASGSNINPQKGVCQALVQINFNSTFTALTSSTILVDNQQFMPYFSSLSYRHSLNEIYCVMGSPNYVYGSNGQVKVWNIQYNQFTSTLSMPTSTQIFNIGCVCISVAISGITGYYTWNEIKASGASNFISVACSRRNPNNLYVLDNTGTAYKGTLVGTTIAFTPFTAIPVDANWKSISLAPDATSFDSYVYEYTISSQTQVGTATHYANTLVPSVARNDVTANYSVSAKNSKIDFYNSATFTNTGSVSLPTANLIYTKAGEDVDAGYADIYNFQVFLDALNGAFAEAYARLKTSGGSLAEAPTASIDFTTQLFTLNYSSDYPESGNGIIFNPALLRIVQYYATGDKTDDGFLKLVLPPSSTSWTQTNKSAYRFNKLNKVLFQSTTIYVSGSFVGINAQNQTISDVDVPTDSYIDNQGQTLYYQPNLLRPYVLGSNNPIDRVQLSILYSYIDGTQYALTIAPDDGWSVLFDFIRKQA